MFPDRTKPVLRYRCALPTSTACTRVQTISPAKEWRRLLPIWRTHDAYQELRVSHDAYERAHHTQRVRYAIGPNSHALRPKRIGIALQQLRATASLILAWLTASEINGWLTSARRRVRRHPATRDSKRGRMHTSLKAARRAHGLLGGDAKPRRE